MITFIECKTPGYKARTLENAKADVTIAFARVNSAGETCTKNCVIANNKLFISLPFLTENSAILWDSNAAYIDVDFNKNMLTATIDKIAALNKSTISLNIAGNGIYSLKTSQLIVDTLIHCGLQMIVDKLRKKNISISSIRSGGQTGIDEAGLKAAVKLGIPAICLAPKNWLFRDINSKDISDEQAFKARFR